MNNIHLLQVLTPLHLGEGAAVGAVDLPIARERHTDWPFIPGSSIKGALRALARRSPVQNDLISHIFGADPDTTLSRGMTSFGDAVLLALPVRTFISTFALITSPLALGRFARSLSNPPNIPVPTNIERVLVSNQFDLRLPGSQMSAIKKKDTSITDDFAILEDLCFLQSKDPLVDSWADFLRRGWLEEEAPLTHLAIVHDDVFAHAVRAWIPTRTRNSVDHQTGVVDDGKLFTVEYLPPEALLWMPIENRQEAQAVLPLDGDAWSLGGHNSTGSGRVTLWREKV